MALAIPPGMKPITQYVRRAERLDTAPEVEASVVAYHCRLYAIEQAMKMDDKTPEGRSFLLSMLDRLEEDKKKGMAQITKAEGEKITHDWALQEFNAADEEDRAGLADLTTAKAFYSAGVFFDVLRQFGQPSEEMNRRRIYCKWKASQINKAIKEGRTPTPGGAGENVMTGMPSSGGEAAPPAPAEAATFSPPLDGGGSAYESKQNDPLAGMIPEAPRDDPFASPPLSPTEETTPTAQDAHAGTTPPTSSSPSYYPPQPYGRGDGTPSSLGPEDAMYAGAAAAVTPSPYARPGPPTPAAAPYVAPVAPSPAPYVAPYVAPAPTPAPGAPLAARPRYDPASQPRTPVPSASGSRRSGGGKGSKPMEGNMADAMEFCRFAIRALEKKDVELAVLKLHEALQQLT